MVVVMVVFGMGIEAVQVVVVVVVVVVLPLILETRAGEELLVVGLTVTVGTLPLHRVAVVEGGVTATTGRTWFTKPEWNEMKFSVKYC